ncbi:hypothetical protein J5N97_000812 [Dioscorea zingiberensis]|uniref:lipoyl(octanoyl) transferase n=1 Tax=Dioscorea zingiberensis TaxID=325984 RepID=A0A9D5H2V7_9LILI|nr:hypothetical protein J5N97_000812 [Dioscorea zingiberensis]
MASLVLLLFEALHPEDADLAAGMPASCAHVLQGETAVRGSKREVMRSSRRSSPEIRKDGGVMEEEEKLPEMRESGKTYGIWRRACATSTRRHSPATSGKTTDNVMPLQRMKLQRNLEVWKMGVVNYLEALKLQERLAADRKVGKIPDTVLSLQHPPTYTLGKRQTYHNLLVSKDDLKTMGAELHCTERGGDITFHGPQQAILYPIISLRDIGFGARNYVEGLESTMIDLASLYGVRAHPGKAGETGVWVGNRKIGAIGVRISSGITSHGLAFNIDPDLKYFEHIVPCGILDKGVTH